MLRNWLQGLRQAFSCGFRSGRRAYSHFGKRGMISMVAQSRQSGFATASESLEDRILLSITRLAYVVAGGGGADIPPRVIDELITLGYEVVLADWNGIKGDGTHDPGITNTTASLVTLDPIGIQFDFPDFVNQAGFDDIDLSLNDINVPIGIQFSFDIGSPNSSAAFVDTVVDSINNRGLTQRDQLVLIGHSLGGDTVLKIAEGLAASSGLEVDLLALLDPVGFVEDFPVDDVEVIVPFPDVFNLPDVGVTFDIPENTDGETPGFFRLSSLVDAQVPTNVKYFYNRWQTNAPFPVDWLPKDDLGLPTDPLGRRELNGGGRLSLFDDFGIVDQGSQDTANEKYSIFNLNPIDSNNFGILAPEDLDLNPFIFTDVTILGQTFSGVPLPNPNFLMSDAQLHHNFPRNNVIQNELVLIAQQMDVAPTATPDQFEENDELLEATILGSEPQITLRDLTIDESEAGIDEDFFQITANQTGSLIINAFFIHCPQLRFGDLDIEIYDSNGRNITPAGQGDSTTDNEQIVIPVVGQERYFLRVFSADGIQNFYDLEIENFATPVPTTIDLDPITDSGSSDIDNNTFGSLANNDPDSLSHIRIQADLSDLRTWGLTSLLTRLSKPIGSTALRFRCLSTANLSASQPEFQGRATDSSSLI